jgi:hypothetical protein
MAPPNLNINKIEWMGFNYRVWKSKASMGEAKKTYIDLIHPLDRFKTIPCRTFQELLIKHLNKRYQTRCHMDIFDWEEGLLQR